jgi:hypothetical protein
VDQVVFSAFTQVIRGRAVAGLTAGTPRLFHWLLNVLLAHQLAKPVVAFDA